MDPDAALALAKQGNKEAARELREWVAKGGFPPRDPNWRKYV